MSKNKLLIAVSGFKAKSDDGMHFTCYGNTKNFRDHAYDVTKDGAFVNSINKHKANGTMPKMFYNHDSWETPVGKWHDMVEDEKGLMMSGEFAPTEKGREMYELLKMGALDSFSIGYKVLDEKWNADAGHNELIEVDLVEVSVVNFACNEESRLVDIKAKLDAHEVPTKRELEKCLREAGLSRKQASTVCSRYNDTVDTPELDIFTQIATLEDN